MPLDYPDLHFLKAARGWLDLNRPEEAARELAQVSAAHAGHPDVQDIRWQIHAHREEWDQALAVARELIEHDPDNPAGWIGQSYALHELKRTQEAMDDLLPVLQKFPHISTIPYNLACYACRLGRLDEARRWLNRALASASQEGIREMALKDPDLRELWAEIQRM